MWKAAAGQNVNITQQNNNDDDDDWETDPDFINDVTEQEQRWGSTTIAGSGRTAGAIDMSQLRKETEEADTLKKKKELMEGTSNPSFGYGGKFGVEKDRMDQSAVGHEYIAKVEKHASQKDYSTGFGGKFGIQSDRVDKSALSWEHKEKVEKHASQKDYVTGFGGKFGVQSDRQDKSAVGWDHIEKVEKHESQKDYTKGFGGKFGVQSDRQDKSAVGWDHHEAPQKHESQTDQKIGFGGKFGLQTDRVDKSAGSFNEEPGKVGTNYTKVKPDIGEAKPGNLRAKFENMAQEKKEEVEKVSTPKKTVHARAAFLSNTISSSSEKREEALPKSVEKLDVSKTAFLTQQETPQHSDIEEKVAPKQINIEKFAQFDNLQLNVSEIPPKSKTEIFIQPTIAQEHQEETYENLPAPSSQTKQEVEVVDEANDDPVFYTTDEIVDTGISAVALYDYQAAANDEISFDPDDAITHIEKIDEGWWRGLCKGKYGLFPANYVQVNE